MTMLAIVTKVLMVTLVVEEVAVQAVMAVLMAMTVRIAPMVEDAAAETTLQLTRWITLF